MRWLSPQLFIMGMLCEFSLLVGTLSAQVQPENGAGELILAERRQIQILEQGTELLKKAEFNSAFQYLQRILDSDDDRFYHPDPKNPSEYRSLRIEVQRLLGDMPAEGKRIYEQVHGPLARAMLNQALEKYDPAAVSEVTRRYFHTQAGYEACYRMGLYHYDASRLMAAALCFERLRKHPNVAAQWEPYLSLRLVACWHQLGETEKVNSLLDELQQLFNGGEFKLAGQRIPLALEPTVRETWLTTYFGSPSYLIPLVRNEWVMYQGNLARNPLGSIPSSSSTNWTAQLIVDPLKDPTDQGQSDYDKELRQIVNQLKNQNPRQLPQLSPVVVGNTLLVRTIGNLQGYELSSGKLLWTTMAETGLASLLEPEELIPQRQQYLSGLIKQRIWEDTTHGSMTSDGNFIFTIEELDYQFPITIPKPNNPGEFLWPGSTNTLVAYHLKTPSLLGQRAWSVGGEERDELFELPLAGAFFLGTPIPLAGRLYVLVDVSGEIRLLCLHPDTGELDWSQPLASAGSAISQDPGRRNAGSSASYADGVLVCTTGAGLVVAIDLTNRSLLWGYRLSNSQSGPPQPFPVPQQSNWKDALPVIAQGKVILSTQPAANGSMEIHCLDLLTGKLNWVQRGKGNGTGQTGEKTDLKGDELYVAAIHRTGVLVVGASQVQSYDLQTGSPQWQQTTAIDTPTGQGFLHDDLLLIPEKDGTIFTIDVTTGKPGPSVQLPEGHTPGNLIAARGSLISQGIETLVVLPVPEEWLDKSEQPAKP